jgi:molecular chaperone Hsp33
MDPSGHPPLATSVPPEDGIEVRTYFVRGRNALVARADFGELYVDYYLHQGQHGYQHRPLHDEMLKKCLAAATLHAAGRPWNESSAWTIHFRELLLNLFVTTDNRLGTVVGQIFTENIKLQPHSLFMADVVRTGQEPRRSAVEFTTEQVFPAVEHFYSQSEQRLARIFSYAEEDFVMISAQPDCDLDWLAALTPDTIRTLDKSEQLSLLERRAFRWSCGCSEVRMFSILSHAMRHDPEALFENEDALRMSCPRCGARYRIRREALEAYVSGQLPGLP